MSADPNRQATVELAMRLLEAVPADAPPEVEAGAALALIRVVALRHPHLAPRIATVLSVTTHELVTGQLFTSNPH